MSGYTYGYSGADFAGMNEPGLRAVQNYADGVIILFLGLFLVLLVGMVLFFVAFYPSTFGIGGAISMNTQIVVGTIASLVVLAGIFTIAVGAFKFNRGRSLMDTAIIMDQAEYEYTMRLPEWQGLLTRRYMGAASFPWRSHLINGPNVVAKVASTQIIQPIVSGITNWSSAPANLSYSPVVVPRPQAFVQTNAVVGVPTGVMDYRVPAAPTPVASSYTSTTTTTGTGAPSRSGGAGVGGNSMRRGTWASRFA